jgi:hypothetical protein
MQCALIDVFDDPAEGTSKPRQATGATETGPAVRPSCPQEAVSPLAGLPLRDLCSWCGREVGAEGCIIPDFEELGCFCDQDCADRQFRLYLEDGPEEEIRDPVGPDDVRRP